MSRIEDTSRERLLMEIFGQPPSTFSETFIDRNLKSIISALKLLQDKEYVKKNLDW